jgi:hypothetical protein
MIETILVSAFPGTGKSHYCNVDVDHMPGNWAIDSDSSKFDKRNFPANYIEHIKSNIGKVKIIFISSHKDVRDALVTNALPFTLVYPNAELKDEYLERYKQRGSSQAFIDLISKNWDAWLEELRNQKGCKHIELQSCQFISNLL